jgi:hypothetical protein
MFKEKIHYLIHDKNPQLLNLDKVFWLKVVYHNLRLILFTNSMVMAKILINSNFLIFYEKKIYSFLILSVEYVAFIISPNSYPNDFFAIFHKINII